jgi:hypothetical protein
VNEQKNECGCVCRDLLGKLIEQNKSLIEQNNQLIQINNEQAAQINHLLEHLDLDSESESSGYLDG